MSQTRHRRVTLHALTTSSQVLTGLVTGLYLAGSVLTAAAAQPPAPPPDIERRIEQGEARSRLVLNLRVREIDDHYATKTAEMKQSIQDALTAAKQAASAAEVAALKVTIARLETQVTRLTAGTTRAEGALTGVTARIELVERAQTERAAKEAAAALSPPPAAIQKPDKPDTSFNEAIAALYSPKETTEPLRRWIELHSTHPDAAEAYLQLGFYLLNRHQPVMATYYLKDLIAAYPLSLQAQEAKSILASPPLADAPKPKVSPKKTAKPSKTASLAPKNGKALSKREDTTPTAAPAIDLPALPRHEAETLGPTSSTPLSPVVPRVASTHTDAPIRVPFLAPPPLDLPSKPVVSTR